MIHMQVREEQVINGLRFGDGKFTHASLAAIEQQPVDPLPGVDAREDGVIVPWLAHYAKLDAHVLTFSSASPYTPIHLRDLVGHLLLREAFERTGAATLGKLLAPNGVRRQRQQRLP